jgi:hypothetical protein
MCKLKIWKECEQWRVAMQQEQGSACHISKGCKPLNTMHREPVATYIQCTTIYSINNVNRSKTASNSTVTMFLLPYFFISSFPLKEKSMEQWWTPFYISTPDGRLSISLRLMDAFPYLYACWRSHMQMTHCAGYRTRQYNWQTERKVSKWLLDRSCAGGKRRRSFRGRPEMESAVRPPTAQLALPSQGNCRLCKIGPCVTFCKLIN